MLSRSATLGFAVRSGAAVLSLLIAGAAIATGEWLWMTWACTVLLFGFAISRLLSFVMHRQTGTVNHLQPIEAPRASGITGVVEIERADGLRVDRDRAYVVVVDGVPAASVRPGDIARLEVAPGEHAVRCHIDWCSSRAIELRLAEGEQATLRCRPQIAPVALLYVLFRPGRYLRLALIAR